MNPYRKFAVIERRLERLERKQLSETEAVNALEAAVAKVAEDLGTATSTIQTELNTLQEQITAGTPPDLTNLTTAVAALDPAVEVLAALKPA